MSLIDTDLEILNAGSNYKFSGTKIDRLGAAEYTLGSIVVDASGSVAGFAAELEKCLKIANKSLTKSPRKENLMSRVTQFNDVVQELHGFKLLDSIKESDYDNILRIGGATALFDATDEAINVSVSYAKQLVAQDFLCNAIIFVITDGDNNTGNIRDAAVVKKSIDKAIKSEVLESLTVVLIGVTDDDVNLDVYLQRFKDEGGINQYVSLGKASPQRLAKLAAFVSQSVSSTSAALGTGAPSQPVNVTF